MAGKQPFTGCENNSSEQQPGRSTQVMLDMSVSSRLCNAGCKFFRPCSGRAPAAAESSECSVDPSQLPDCYYHSHFQTCEA